VVLNLLPKITPMEFLENYNPAPTKAKSMRETTETYSVITAVENAPVKTALEWLFG